MGYWEQDASGMSFTGDGTTVWGDPPADTLANALAQISDQFIDHLGRPPTVGEIKSGLLFSLSFLADVDDDVMFTDDNRQRAMNNRLDGENNALTRLDPNWRSHAKGTYS
jgi:hypothetical protein